MLWRKTAWVLGLHSLYREELGWGRRGWRRARAVELPLLEGDDGVHSGPARAPENAAVVYKLLPPPLQAGTGWTIVTLCIFIGNLLLTLALLCIIYDCQKQYWFYYKRAIFPWRICGFVFVAAVKSLHYWLWSLNPVNSILISYCAFCV